MIRPATRLGLPTIAVLLSAVFACSSPVHDRDPGMDATSRDAHVEPDSDARDAPESDRDVGVDLEDASRDMAVDPDDAGLLDSALADSGQLDAGFEAGESDGGPPNDASAPDASVCSDGDNRPCGGGTVNGAPAVCREGVQRCLMGTWGACEGAVGPETGDACDGLDNDCNGTVDDACPCTAAETRACGGGTVNGGTAPCRQGAQRCSGGSWGACSGSVGPAPEQCRADGLDEDCDGSVNESDACDCIDGVDRPCGGGTFNGAPAVCRRGTETCDEGRWSDCSGAIGPASEACDGASLDEDCDGTANEGCTCSDGATQPCGGGAVNAAPAVCRQGEQTCMSGSWGACVGAVGAGAEACTATMLDEDCDGMTNEGCDCTDGTMRACGGGMVNVAPAICRQGMQSCASGMWGTCMGQVVAGTESCDAPILDEDCDGMSNEGCDCTNGTMRACGGGTVNVAPAICRRGMESCASGMWGTCTGATAPTAELCSPAGVDEDCDGQTNNGCCPGTPGTWRSISTTGAPSARFRHVIVWTGTEALVWGGYSAVVLGDGAAWNPVTNTWRTLSAVGAPTARTNFAGVWTGSLLVVWGGSPGPVSDGARYDPALDAWTPMATSPLAARSSPMTANTSQGVFVWGGGLTGGTPAGDGAMYHPGTNTWTAITSVGAPPARQNSGVVWTGTEVVLWGGSSGGLFNTGGRYNPATNTWLSISTTGAPSARTIGADVWASGYSVIWGGEANNVESVDNGRYDPVADSWLPISPTGAPSPRQQLTWAGRENELFVWGGLNHLPSLTFLGDGGRYNPTSDTWTTLPSIGAPSARNAMPAVWTGCEYVLWGGESPSGGTGLADGATFTP